MTVLLALGGTFDDLVLCGTLDLGTSSVVPTCRTVLMSVLGRRMPGLAEQLNDGSVAHGGLERLDPPD